MARGGKRPGAGRKKSTPAAVKAFRDTAQEYALPLVPAAMAALKKVLTSSKSDSAKVSAATEVLNRAFGKPRQEVTGLGGGPVRTVDVATLARMSPEELDAYERLAEKYGAAAPDGAGRPGGDPG